MKSPDYLINQSWGKPCIILVALMLAPLFSFAQATTSTKVVEHVFLEGHSDSRKIQWRSNGSKFNLEHKGYITMSEDDSDVVAISAGGYLRVSKSAFGSKRRLSIEADRNGNLIRKYYEGRSKKDYEPNGRAWLAEVLPEIIRSSTLGAEDRVDRIYTSSGMDAFISELGRLEGNYVKTAYIRIVLCKDLKDQEVDQLMSVIGREITSDHYLSGLLEDHYALFLANSQGVDAFVKASRNIDSDHHMTEVLTRVVTSDQIGEAQLPSILAITNNIQSDHYLSSLLIDLLNHRELSPNTLVSLLQSSEDIQSDHYLSEVLRRVAEQDNLSDSAYERFLAALAKIDSDHYAKEVIFAVGDQRFSSTILVEMLDQIGREIDSDHYLGEALQYISRKQELSGPGYTAFLRATTSIGSDNYAAEVFRNLTHNERLSEDQLIELLEATNSIQSDHYLTGVLLEVAPMVEGKGEEVKNAYRAAAKTIHSETYYGRAMRALN